jgi:hypothetical protein
MMQEWHFNQITIMKPPAFALLSGLLLLTACSTPSPSTSLPRFIEAGSADIIVRHYTDQTSYVLKPSMMDGDYLSIFDRAGVLSLAAQQPRRELAVVVLIYYPCAEVEEFKKQNWLNDLKALGYQRIVFLRGGSSMAALGLPVLGSPSASTTMAGR